MYCYLKLHIYICPVINTKKQNNMKNFIQKKNYQLTFAYLVLIYFIIQIARI